MNPAAFNPADALAEHPAERVRAAVRALTTTAGALTGELPTGGYIPGRSNCTRCSTP